MSLYLQACIAETEPHNDIHPGLPMVFDINDKAWSIL